jgi:hypothetical protein
MKKNTFLCMPFLLSALFLISCTKDKAPVATPIPTDCADTISFAHQIGPLLNDYCISCHNPSNPSAGYHFTTHADVSENAMLMLSAIRHESGVSPMPQNMPSIPDSLIQQFSCWVAQGKLDN